MISRGYNPCNHQPSAKLCRICESCFLKAFNVFADLSDVDNFPPGFGPR